MQQPRRFPALLVLAIALAGLPLPSVAAPGDPAQGADEAPADRKAWIQKMIDLPADNVKAALEDPSRSDADRARDAEERSEAVLREAGIARDMRVGDAHTGDGWFARLLLLATRRFGRVYAANDPASVDPATAAAWKKRLEDPANADIAKADGPLSAGMPGWVRPLDVVFLRDAARETGAAGFDRVAMHAGVFAATRSKGRYVVIEARAADGESTESAAAKCRADEGATRRDVEAAGFRFVASSEALRDVGDDRRGSACGSGARDRFLLVFEKPAAAQPPAAPAAPAAP